MTRPNIVTPRKYAVSPQTGRANQLLKTAGAFMQSLAKENTALQDTVLELREKVSQAERRDSLVQVALSAAGRGLIPVRQVLSKVSQWEKESHPVSYYAELLRAQMDHSFASVEGGQDTTKQSGVDSRAGFAQDSREDGLSDSTEAFHSELSAFLRH